MYGTRISKRTTWSMIKSDSRITQVQHPIYNNIYSKKEFEDEFELLLNKLNGHSVPEEYDYLGFYVEINPLNGCLKFKNEDTKGIFIDWAIELKIVPPLIEIFQGESLFDQESRQQLNVFDNLPQISEDEQKELNVLLRLDNEKSKYIQQQKKSKKNQGYSQFYHDYLIILNIWTSCHRNRTLILSEKNYHKKKNLQRKIELGSSKLNSKYLLFQKDYPDKKIFPEYNSHIQEKLEEIKFFLSK